MNCDWAYTGNTIANGFKEVRCTRCGLVGYSPYPLANIINPVGCSAPGIPRPNVPPPEHGPGTELHKLIASLGITPDASCQCEAMRLQMDRGGVEWCREHRLDILVHLKAAYTKTDWPTAFRSAALGPLMLGVFSSEGLLDLAIERAEQFTAPTPPR